MSKLKFIINRSEITAGTRGASLGPEAIMTAARAKEETLFGDHPVHFIKDHNYLLDQTVNHPHAKRVDGLIKTYETIADNVSGVVLEGNFPFVIAGDHGSAGGTIAGLKKAYPNKRLGVVWIDAHGDIHTPYTTPSGNMHGMPLATALGEDNLESKRNAISDEVAQKWQQLKDTGVKGVKVKPEDVVFVAVRDTEQQEDEMMERLNLKNYSVAEFREKTVAVVLGEIKAKLADCDFVYVSFDVDSMDPQYTSYGTGTPVENGLKPEEAEGLLVGLYQMQKTQCVEFVEVNPCLDEKKNKMAEVAYDLIKKLVNTPK